jgi:hypothetical protein
MALVGRINTSAPTIRVANIQERDNLSGLMTGTEVIVEDATGDFDIVEGSATYKYDKINNTFKLITKPSDKVGSIVDVFKEIVGGVVVLDDLPIGSLVNMQIIDNSNSSEPLLKFYEVPHTINGLNVSFDTSAYNGLYLKCSYLRGEIRPDFQSLITDLTVTVADTQV